MVAETASIIDGGHPNNTPSGKCLCRIAPAAAMVNEFVETTQNTNNTHLLTSNYGTFRALVNGENFIPQNGPSNRVINATSFV